MPDDQPTRQPGRATWFCIDIECSGPVPSLYDMLSIGAVRVTLRDGQADLSEPFYVEIQPRAPRVDAGALAVCGLDIERLKREGTPLPQALQALTDWTRAHTLPGTKPVFVGHNAPFDWSFINWSYVACELDNPFGYKALDTKALAMGILGVHWFDANKELLQQLLELPPQDAEQVHRADYDAWYQAHILAALLMRRPSCVDL